MDDILQVEKIKESNYLLHAIDKEELTIRFDTLYQEPRIQGFFSGLLNGREDIVARQFIMSHALLHLRNAKADFNKQIAQVRPCSRLELVVSSTKELDQDKVKEMLDQHCPWA